MVDKPKKATSKPKKLKSGLTNFRGKKFGFLEVIGLHSRSGKYAKWKVKCTAKGCGKVFIVAHYVLARKIPKTHCGCQSGGLPKKYKREYHSWWDAKNRCHNPKHPSYPFYGAQGVRMCEEWRKGFEYFLKDVGPAPKGFTLDRINPHGNYEPTNCRWADDLTQARNKKGSKYVVHPKTGKRVLAAALADEYGVTYQTLRAWMVKKGLWYDPAAKTEDIKPSSSGKNGLSKASDE